MKLIQINWKPTNRQLRQFGFICLVALPLVGWLWGASSQVLAWLFGIGLLGAICGIVIPRVLAPLFVVLSVIATPIGMLLSEIILLLIYFVVFLPIGLIFRLIGRNALQTKPDRSITSYWRNKPRPDSVESYYRQS